MAGRAPSWRRGAQKAALEQAGVRHDELVVREDGSVELPAKRERGASEVAGDTAGAKLGTLAVEVIEELAFDLRHGEGHDRREAARLIAQLAASCKIIVPAPAEAPAPPELTAEERAARLDASLAAPDAELSAALARAGWVRASTEGV